MTDDELIVRHLRLCECGKPAGHQSICWTENIGTEQRVPLVWENAHADIRRERSDARKRRVSNDRRAAMARYPDWKLVSMARKAELLLSTVHAASLESSGGGGSERVGPTTQLLEHDPRWYLAKRSLRQSAERLIEIADEIRGYGMAAGAINQLGEHKDAAIMECVGLKPREVVQHLGSAVAGGTRTVERVREAGNACRWCGRDWPHA